MVTEKLTSAQPTRMRDIAAISDEHLTKVITMEKI